MYGNSAPIFPTLNNFGGFKYIKKIYAIQSLWELQFLYSL